MFINQKNYDPEDHIKERDWGKSKTVPNMAISVKEILQRTIEGRPVPDVLQELKSMSKDEVTFDDINPLIKSIDPLTMSDELKAELSEINKRIKEREDKKKKDDEKAKIESRAEEIAKSKSEKNKSEQKPDESGE